MMNDIYLIQRGVELERRRIVEIVEGFEIPVPTTGEARGQNSVVAAILAAIEEKDGNYD